MSQSALPLPARALSSEQTSARKDTELARRKCHGVDGGSYSSCSGVSRTHRTESATLAKPVQLRQSNFKNAFVLATSGPWRARKASYNSADDLDPPPPREQAGKTTKTKRLSDDLGILQEISNQSLRRQRAKSDAEDVKSLDDGAITPAEFDHTVSMIWDENGPCTGPISAKAQAASSLQLSSRKHSPGHTEDATLKGVRKRNAKIISKRTVSGNEVSRYVEHLESQLSALQSQLQSFVESSLSQTQSEKLRALEAEAKLLRQELGDWENKFEDRVGDYFDQHEKIVASLRAELRTMQREIETSNQRLKELEDEATERQRQLIAVEAAKTDLEKRIEIMSEMLATSPSKLDLSFGPESHSRQRSVGRPKSFGPGSFPLNLPLLSPRRKAESPLRSGAELESPSVHMVRPSKEFNSFNLAMMEPLSADSSTEADSEASEATLVNPMSPWNSRPNSMFGSEQLCSREKAHKPARRMRRFHSGSTGPRSLILASNTSVHTASAPATASSALVPEDDNLCSDSWQATSDAEPNPNQSDSTGDLFDSTISSETILASSQLQVLSEDPSPEPFRDTAPFDDFDHDDQGRDASQRSSFDQLPDHNLFQKLTYASIGPTTEEDPRPSTAKPSKSSQAAAPLDHATDSSSTNIEPQTGPTLPAILKHRALSSIHGAMSLLSRSSNRPLSSTPQDPTQRQPIDEVVRATVASTWSRIALSRPVLEFRWWLVRILIGGLEKKGAIVRRSALLERRRRIGAEEVDAVLISEEEGVRSGVNWLKIGVTLLFAVGVVLKDGPRVVLTGQARRLS